MTKRKERAPTFMDKEVSLRDPLEYRRLMGLVVKDCAIAKLILVTPRQMSDGEAVLSVTINATVMDLTKFIRDWAESFGDNFYIEVTRPEWPRKYIAYYESFGRMTEFLEDDDDEPRRTLH